jgi:NAD(P)-dependent dehydrogenase (short-subunit alcohol dehydrogenase family)
MALAKTSKVVLITGASSGIGFACAARLAAEGHTVYGASRSMPTAALPGPCPGLQRLAMDVTDEASVRQAVGEVVKAEGRIDVLVNNAGYVLSGASEEISIEEAHRQLDTNFFGYLRATRAVLPTMRGQRAGLILNMSSLAGMIGLPFQSMYSASKFAIEGWSEALRIELAPHGIQVVLVQPGDIKTAFTQNRVRAREAQASGPYAEALERSLAVMEADEQGGPSPDVIASTVSRIIRHPAPPLRHRAGDAFQCAAVGLKHWLPAGLVEWGLRRYYKLT